MAINGQGLNGLPFEKVKAMLQKAPASVMLTIQEPTCLLHGKRFLPSGRRYTWPVEVEKAPLYKSISEGQFPLSNGHYICSMCNHRAAGQNITTDAPPTPLSLLPQPGAESGSIQNGQEFKDISPVATTPASPQPRGSDETGSAVRVGPSSSTRYGGTPETLSIQHGQGLKDTTADQTHCSSPRPKGYAVQPTGYSETRSAAWDGPSSSARYGGTQQMGTIQNGQELKDTSAAQTTSHFASPELAGCNDQPTRYSETKSATSNGPSSSTRYGGTQQMGTIQNGQELKDTSAAQTTSNFTSPELAGCNDQPTGYHETRSATSNGPSSSTRYGGTQQMGNIQNGQELIDTSAAQTTSNFTSPELAGCNDQPTGYHETRCATSNGPSSSTRYGGTQEMGSIQHGQGLKDTTAVQTTSPFTSPDLAGCNGQPTGYSETRSATWSGPSSSTRYGGTEEMGTLQNGQELTDSSAAQTTSLFTSPELVGCNDQPTGYDETRSAMCNGATSTTRHGSLGMSIIQNGEEFKDAEKKLSSLSLHGGLPNSPLPLPSDYGIANGATIHCRLSGIQESGTPLSLPSEPCETPKDQEIPVCQNCLSITVTDKREHSIEQVPGTIYYLICMRLDKKSCFLRDYRIMGEKLGFSRRAISLLENNAQPTDCLLNEWIARKGKEATVSVLMEILSEMERQELLDLLQSWTDTCPKCFETQQKNVRESYI